jgi:hypothetical protein
MLRLRNEGPWNSTRAIERRLLVHLPVSWPAYICLGINNPDDLPIMSPFDPN